MIRFNILLGIVILLATLFHICGTVLTRVTPCSIFAVLCQNDCTNENEKCSSSLLEHGSF